MWLRPCWAAVAFLLSSAAGIGTIEAAGRLRLDDVTRFGDDVRLTSYPKGA